MEIHLPEELRRFVADEVRAGRYASADELVRLAVERFKQARESAAPSGLRADPWLGSMREDAALLDEIVEDTMRIRESRPWRLPAGE